MCNAFTFDDRNGVKAYVKKLKGIDMCKVCMSEHVVIVSSNAYSCFLMALQDVPLSTEVEKAKKLCFYFQSI